MAEPRKILLKTIQPYFDDIIDGTKKFEVRYNDRKFKVGDILILGEWSESKGQMTGRALVTEVDYVLDDVRFCKSGYVVLQLGKSEAFSLYPDVFNKEKFSNA
jgi:hypothetical protein